MSALIGDEAVVGQVTLRGNDIYWNGRKIPRDSYGALAAACGLRRCLYSFGHSLSTYKASYGIEY